MSLKRVMLVLVFLPMALYVGSCVYREATYGCHEPPWTLDACRDPYQAVNATDGPITVYRVDETGREFRVTSFSGPGWLPLYTLNREGPRCQDGFNLVARDEAGREIARQDRLCRFEEWVISTPAPPG